MFRDATIAALVCPSCRAANRRGATYIELDDTGKLCFCSVCSKSGQIAEFQPKAAA